MAKKQKSLPGMENRKMADLVDKATEYVEIRDKRMDLSRRESELKGDLLGLMKKHKRAEYVFEGVEIRVVTEQETVKVKISKADPEESEDGEGAEE